MSHRKFPNMGLLISIMLTGCGTVPEGEFNDSRIASPDGRQVAEFKLNSDGAPQYDVRVDGRPVILDSHLGLVRNDADFTRALNLRSVSKPERVADDYEILTAKRRVNHYRANRRVFHLETPAGQKMDIVFQVSNDGLAFRYVFPETNSAIHRINEEVSSFHFLPGTKAFLQPMAVAKSGWSQTNPSYEEYYEVDIPVGTPSTFGAGWVFPALFRSDDTWLVVSETGLERNYCGSRLRSESPDNECTIGFPDPKEGFDGGAVNPESKLPWATPWRVIAIGSLKTIAESMLGVDLAPAALSTATPVEPGKASWSWPLLGDANTKYDVQKRFIDYAADMGWRYCLIDALWDQQIGYDKIRELVDYAKGKEVGILLWYNSAGDWNTAPQTPRNLMLTHESRVKEFARLKAMGVAGVKIDFFGGDGQSMIAYYHDILRDAGEHGLLVNFHGCTPPRGWQRTYPHLMSMEAIRGLEFVTFEQPNADREASHAAMLPFTRNVFDPMDFTPMALDRINDRITRRTTSAFELALSILFTSGIQHYAEIPQGMAKAPGYVRDFIKHIPTVWDEVKFIDGYPGKYVVLARQGEGRWYVCGINGESTERRLKLNLSDLHVRGTGTLITDGEDEPLLFQRGTARLETDQPMNITLPPRGGFVMVFD